MNPSEFLASVEARMRKLDWTRVCAFLGLSKPPGNHHNRCAKRLRAALILELGSTCVKCGESNARRLEFDHCPPTSRTWEARAMNQFNRMRRYLLDAADGHIQLRCRKCNAKKGTRCHE